MTFLQARTTKVALCVVVFFVASGFAGVIPIPVTNPSFETSPTGGIGSPCTPSPCFFSTSPIPGWTSTGAVSGQLLPGTPPNTGNFNFVPNGDTIAWSNGGTISQTVAATVQPGVTYELTVALGDRKTSTATYSFVSSADLLAGTTVVATATGNPPSSGNWSTYTAEFTGTAAEAGDTITIQLVSTGVQGAFDNVSLNAVPEPSSMLLLGSGVLVLVQGLRRKLL